jgi:hypothetical protein
MLDDSRQLPKKNLISPPRNLTDININKHTYNFNMDSIILPSALNVDAMTYGSVKTNDNGGKSIYVSLNSSPIIIQTPEMFAPFGMSKWDNDKAGTVKYTMDLSFKDVANRPSLKTFFDKISEFDEKLINDGTVNQFEWLKKKGVSKDTIKELYTSMIKYPIDKVTGEISGKYPPTFKLSIPFRDNHFQCEVYNENREVIDINEIETKGAKVTAIIQCLGIWSAGGKYGCSWKCIQMKVRSPKAIKGFAFQDDGEKIEDEEKVTTDSESVDNNHDDPLESV